VATGRPILGLVRQLHNSAYIDNFALMMMIVIFSIPLLLLVRRARPALQAERAG
jgi:hypothetical protein